MTPTRKRAIAPLLSAPRYELLPLADVAAQAAALPPGAIVTVTSSPRQGQDATVAAACDLAVRGLRVVPHLAARRVRSAGHLEEVVGRLIAAGVDDVFCVGGDGEAEGPYASALGLLEAMAVHGTAFTDVGVAGYPEGHHAVGDAELDAALVAKQPFASYVTTQLCFDAGAVARWARRLRAHGVTLPILAGVPGVVDTRKLLRVSRRIGIGESLRFLRGNRAAVLRLLRAGAYRPDGLVRELAALDGDARITGLHLYTFNEAAGTARWVERARGRDRSRRRVVTHPSRRRGRELADSAGG